MSDSRSIVVKYSPATVRLAWAGFVIFALGFTAGMGSTVWADGSLDRTSGAWVSASVMGLIALLGHFYWHPYRILGFVPMLLLVAALATLVAWWIGSWDAVTFGLSSLALWTTLFLAKPAWTNDVIPKKVFMAFGVALLATVAAVMVLDNKLSPQDKKGLLPLLPPAVLCLFALVTFVAWNHFFRPWFELMIEVPLWVMYRIRGAGPGLKDFPIGGPCLVIANHACWFDPIILAKLLPRPLTSMMTGRFYDLPVISFLMRRFGIIKVREQSMRRELPELQEAIAALDRGECVVVFPEGYLRRSEDRPLKRFGQGIWQILKARPDTPIYTCWIEGGWGSYTSYFKGKPTQNKKPDFRRPIGLGVSDAVVLDTEMLASHLATRIDLMNRVIAARAHLGLPALPAYQLPQVGEADDEGDK